MNHIHRLTGTLNLSTLTAVHDHLLNMTAVSGVFKSLPSVLDCLAKHKEDEHVVELLRIYEDESRKTKFADVIPKHKFVVFEGLDGSGKSLLTRLTAKRLQGIRTGTPPKCVSHLRAHFDEYVNNQELRRAFYSLGNYIAADQVRSLVCNTPVIMDRFWHSTAAYAIAGNKELKEIPEDVYKWPLDLLKPDLVVFLTVSEDVRLERMSRRKNFTVEEDQLKANASYRNMLTETFRKMEAPSLMFINCDGVAEEVVDQVVATLEK